MFNLIINLIYFYSQRRYIRLLIVLQLENLFVHTDNRPHLVLIDFGSCCREGNVPTDIIGPYDFVAPEQITQQKVTTKSDIWYVWL